MPWKMLLTKAVLAQNDGGNDGESEVGGGANSGCDHQTRIMPSNPRISCWEKNNYKGKIPVFDCINLRIKNYTQLFKYDLKI